jgi:eukaryotic-like serine/threonine-protein kinase
MLDREFGRYRLVRRLGRGGMADVYLARDAESGAEVALKLVEQRPDRDSREICDAERRGAALQQQFSRVDGHVPQVHAAGELDGYFYIDMEYVEGEDLAERIARGPMAADEAVWIAVEIADFLLKAHQFEATLDGVRVRGIIHADIKPKNVRLNLAGQVKVLDFGIAKGLALSRKLTRNDFGSLSYLSPERLDSGEVDVHVDFWSVGVLLYEMLAGSPPFEADSNQKLEALIRRRQPPPPLPDACPPGLARIVLKMLAGDIGRRYPDAAEMLVDLEAFRDGGETLADREWMAEVEREATRRTLPDRVDGDQGETRRTIEVQGDVAGPEGEATRRTIAAPGEGGAVPAVPEEAARPAAGPPRFARLRRWTAAAVVLAAIGVVGNEAIVWSAARDLRVSVVTGQSAQMHDLWSSYDDLARRSLLGIGLVGLRAPLKERLISNADRVIADYRQDEPAVREAQWRDAATWLSDALHLDPGDRTAMARLRYCEGQLQRIDGEARRRKKQSAVQPLHDAVMRFEEAARLDSRWPDPYLGLARTYIYGLDDVDKAVAALRESENRGYRPGNRELVQLADGYRNRAERMRREAAAVRALGQERDCLQKAADDYRKALELYGKAIGFGGVSATMLQVQSRLDDVQKRLDSMEPST